MDKSKRRCETRCQEHKFSLVNPFFPKLDTQTTFCPKYHREPRQPENTFPIFNNDGNYFTCAFILGVDKRALERNEKQELIEHNKQVRDALQRNGKIVFPKPHKRHTHCAVCKQKYKNYLAHIMSESHKSKINSNIFNRYILQLAYLYKDLHISVAPSPIQLVDIQPKYKQKKLADRQDAHKQQIRTTLLQKARETKTIPKQIIQYIISSDSEDQQSQITKRNSSHRSRSSQDDSSSESDQSSSESNSSDESARIEQINLDSDVDEDSVQIVSFRPSKQKKSKKINKHKKQKKSKHKKHDHKKKNKKGKKSSKNDRKHKKRERSPSVQLDSNKKKAIKSKTFQPPTSVPPNNKKRTKLGKQALPANQKPEQCLIIKQHVLVEDGSKRQIDLQNILSSLVQKIKINGKVKEEKKKDQIAKKIAKVNNPFTPLNIKKNIEEKLIRQVDNNAHFKSATSQTQYINLSVEALNKIVQLASRSDHTTIQQMVDRTQKQQAPSLASSTQPQAFTLNFTSTPEPQKVNPPPTTSQNIIDIDYNIPKVSNPTTIPTKQKYQMMRGRHHTDSKHSIGHHGYKKKVDNNFKSSKFRSYKQGTIELDEDEDVIQEVGKDQRKKRNQLQMIKQYQQKKNLAANLSTSTPTPPLEGTPIEAALIQSIPSKQQNPSTPLVKQKAVIDEKTSKTHSQYISSMISNFMGKSQLSPIFLPKISGVAQISGQQKEISPNSRAAKAQMIF